MIITLKNANFSENNVGQLNSWFIFAPTVSGGVVTADSNNPSSIDKTTLPATTLKYTFDTAKYNFISCTPSVGIATHSNGLITVTIPKGTTIVANITISIVLERIGGDTGGEEEEPVNPPSGDSGITWYINSLDAVAATGKDITGGTKFTGSSIAPVAFDNTFNAKLVGKTIDTVEFVPENAGEITLGVYNTTTYAYTEKASITIEAADLNTRKIYTFTPFTVSSGELFTFYKPGNTGCMSYYLAKDVSGVDYCKGLQTKCNGAAPSAFNYDIITLINVGTSSGSGGNVTPETPSGNTTWYINSLKQLQDSGNDIAANRVELLPSTAYHWAFNQFNSKLAGKTINTIELIPCKSGTFTVGVFDTGSNTVTDTRSITINAADINTVKTYTFNNLTIPSGKYFVWNCSGKNATGGEAAGYYVLKAKLDPLAVETSNWYQVKSTGLTAFGTHELVFVANIGYTG